jgi:omega-6 fatty acid desaturase (delta-12 desaturase)
VAMWERFSPARKLAYRVVRHPATMIFGYFTVFLWGMCIAPLFRNFDKSRDAALSLVVYSALAASVIGFAGLDVFFYAMFLPHFIACAVGSYLFYAQHNYPDMVLRSRHDWSYTDAALNAASYMKMSWVMEYFSGNIGYHHVHHLNSSIPFYRLPEVMAAVPELQEPGETTLLPGDIVACTRLKLWDGERKRMVAFPENG